MSKIQVKPIKQNVVINHKTEQVVRAMYFGYDGYTTGTLVTSPVRGSIISLYEPDDVVVVGTADAKGYRFTAASNSALITLGYHPTAVLLLLTQMRYEGEPVVGIQGDELVCTHAAVVQCARDVVFNYEKVQMIKGKPRVVGKPILENYLRVGKPKNFA